MVKQARTLDDLKELVFPFGGLQLTQPSLMSRPDTTPEAENVRAFESLTGRERGGSRPGITRFVNEQVSGDHEIQHMNTIVTVDGEMLDYSFGFEEQRFPGIYAGLGFIDFDFTPINFPRIPDDGAGGDGQGGETFQGGSGYAPAKPKNEKIKLTLHADEDVVLTTAATTLTITATDQFDLPLNVISLNGTLFVLSTDPPDNVGDGASGEPIGGVFQVVVSSSDPKVVYYKAKVVSALGNTVAVSNTIHIRFDQGAPPPPPPIALIQSRGNSTSGTGPVTVNMSLTQVGDFIVVFVAIQDGGTGGVTFIVTDSHSNTYTQAGAYVRETMVSGTEFRVLAAFWAKANATGSNVVSVTASASTDWGFSASIFRNTNVSPFRSTSSNSAHQPAGFPVVCTTTSISASSGDAIIAAFVNGAGLTVGSGYTFTGLSQAFAGATEWHSIVSGAEAATANQSSAGDDNSTYCAIGISFRPA